MVARMLQRHHKYVSMADGGYEALLFYIESNSLEADRILVGTDVQKKSRASSVKKDEDVPVKTTAVSASASFFGKMANAVKTQLPLVKDKVRVQRFVNQSINQRVLSRMTPLWNCISNE